MSTMVSIRLDDDLVSRIDEKAGEGGRSAWIKGALEAAVAGGVPAAPRPPVPDGVRVDRKQVGWGKNPDQTLRPRIAEAVMGRYGTLDAVQPRWRPYVEPVLDRLKEMGTMPADDLSSVFQYQPGLVSRVMTELRQSGLVHEPRPGVVALI